MALDPRERGGVYWVQRNGGSRPAKYTAKKEDWSMDYNSQIKHWDDINVGDVVTIHTDALTVTATTAGGVAEIVEKCDNNDLAGDRVLVRFA